jgi:hypothetical protein
MAFVTPCPKCGTRLKSAHRLPAGQRLTCPGCRGAFITQKESDPFIPDAVLLDEPADDRPPVARRRGRKARRHDPVPMPRRSEKKSARPALVVGLILGVLFIGLAVGLLAYSVGTERRKPATNDLLAHAPADALILSGFDLDALAGHEAFRKSLERRAPADLVDLDRAGLRIADLSRVLVARTPNNGHTCVLRFKEAPDRSKYLGPDFSGRTYAAFTSLSGSYRFGYFADPSTLVLADKEPAIQALREKGPRVRLAGGLQDMLDEVRGPVWRASGRITPTDFPRLGAEDHGLALRIGPSSGTAAWLVPDGRLAQVHFELTFDNPGQAGFGASVLRGTFQLQRGVNDFGQLVGREGMDPSDFADIRRGYDEASVSDSGRRASARLTLPAAEALRAVTAVRY